MDNLDDLRAHVQQWDQGVWCLAALARSLQDPTDEAAAEVLTALGLGDVRAAAGPLAAQVAAQASAPLAQAAQLVSGRSVTWADQPDEALLAQGAASAQAAPMFARFVLPRMPGLAERLAADGAAMLDVGTGTGALAVAYAEQFPALRVVGLDVLPRVLKLAERVIAGSTAGERVELREQSVADLDDDAAFDLAWLPAPFVPPGPLRAGLARVRAALRPGGWVILGHGKFGSDALENALNTYKTVAFGGTALDDDAARELLETAGFVDVGALPAPPGAPALTIGRAG